MECTSTQSQHMNINTNNTVTGIRHNINTGRVAQSQSNKKDKHVYTGSGRHNITKINRL